MADIPKIKTVTQINSEIKKLIELNFLKVSVEGEVSNFKVANSGHVFFTLKDENSEIPCVMFRSNFSRLNIKVSDGLKIVVIGNINVYIVRGRYQIQVFNIIPSGYGILQYRFEQLKKELESKGWFDKSIKKKLPEFPETIGVITSSKGAALKDIINVIKRRYPKIKLLIYSVSVQGENSKFEIKQAFDYFNSKQKIDLIILSRGGGSIEDLWPFNEKIVAESIYNCNIPVLTGIGHETDFTIADFVSDFRAPTPSAAAEIAVPDLTELYNKLFNFRNLLVNDLRSKLKFCKHQVDNIKKSYVFKKPFDRIDRYNQYLTELQNKMYNNLNYKKDKYKHFLDNIVLSDKLKNKVLYKKQGLSNIKNNLYNNFKFIVKQKNEIILNLKSKIVYLMENKIQQNKTMLNSFSKNLMHLNPDNIIDKGYSIIYMNDKPVLSVNELHKKDKIDARMKNGRLKSEIIDIIKDKQNE